MWLEIAALSAAVITSLFGDDDDTEHTYADEAYKAAVERATAIRKQKQLAFTMATSITGLPESTFYGVKGYKRALSVVADSGASERAEIFREVPIEDLPEFANQKASTAKPVSVPSSSSGTSISSLYGTDTSSGTTGTSADTDTSNTAKTETADTTTSSVAATNTRATNPVRTAEYNAEVAERTKKIRGEE